MVRTSVASAAMTWLTMVFASHGRLTSVGDCVDRGSVSRGSLISC
jgi:hypothetical protein